VPACPCAGESVFNHFFIAGCASFQGFSKAGPEWFFWSNSACIFWKNGSSNEVSASWASDAARYCAVAVGGSLGLGGVLFVVCTALAGGGGGGRGAVVSL
jgi:hypothetical protein